MKTRVTPLLLCNLAFGLLAAGPAAANRAYSVAPGINVLTSGARLVGDFVKTRYPGAETHAFEDVIHFEHATRLYVLPEIALDPEPPQCVERGPLSGGVWCDIDYVPKALKDGPPYTRAEGTIDRGTFVEYRYYVAPPSEPDCHLILTVRIPKDAGEKGKQFVEGLRNTLKEFHIDRQTESTRPSSDARP